MKTWFSLTGLETCLTFSFEGFEGGCCSRIYFPVLLLSFQLFFLAPTKTRTDVPLRTGQEVRERQYTDYTPYGRSWYFWYFVRTYNFGTDVLRSYGERTIPFCIFFSKSGFSFCFVCFRLLKKSNR